MTSRYFSPLLAAALVAVAASGAGAATLHEADLPGAAFGVSWDAPTEVAQGFDTIAGTGEQNRYDTFVFKHLTPGAQRLTFAFAAPAGHGHSYSAGGEVLYAATPFRWGWDGTRLGRVQVDHGAPSQSLALDLAEDFGGTLYLALNFTHGADLAYTISAPGNAAAVAPAPAPVPVPAGLALIVTAAAALGLARVARGRTAAA